LTRREWSEAEYQFSSDGASKADIIARAFQNSSAFGMNVQETPPPIRPMASDG
jgi:hypothetical protein